MKRFKFNIHRGKIDKFFPKKRVKTKAQIIEILMETLQLILQNRAISKDKIAGKVILIIDKMSRLFFISDNKFYSIAFPFYIREENGNFIITLQKFDYIDYIEDDNDIFIEVDYEIISNVLSFIKCDNFKNQCSLDFITPIYEYEFYEKKFWIFLRELLLMEDGYIRYDYDPINYKKAKERDKPYLHPLHHYDLFYSSNATFKIGLSDKIANDDFIDFLDINSNCQYLTKPTSME